MISILKFGAEWCGPCAKQEPILDQLQLDVPELNIQRIDIDEAPDLAAKYKIRTLPTILILQDDIEVNRLVGLTDLITIKQRIYEQN